MLKVVKLGGSSLCDAAHFKLAADIVKSDASRRYVVPSAPGKRFSDDIKVTDMLYAFHKMVRDREDAESIDAYYDLICTRYNEIIDELGLDLDISHELMYIKNAILGRAGRDFAASRGEYLSGLILAKYLGYDFIDAENVIFFTETGAFDADRTQERMRCELARHERAVIPGFYGIMPNETIKTFSRGGSDVTGSIVAQATEADLYENWTDVSGFKMADPRIVDDPLTIKTITYRELRELSYMGATVLHEEAIFPVRYAGIPINIRNTLRPQDPGTMIVAAAQDYDSEHVITGVAGKRGFTVITLEQDMMNSDSGFGRRVLEIFEEYGIAFEHLPSGIDTMSVVLESATLEGRRERIINSLRRSLRPNSITIEDNVALIAVVGRGMVKAHGTAARVFSAISAREINVRMIDQGSSELNIIIGVEEHDFEAAIRAIYCEFVR